MGSTKPSTNTSTSALSSCEEGEYDFAILLRASKQAEIIQDQPQGENDMVKHLSDTAARVYFKQHPDEAKDLVIQKLKVVGLVTTRLLSLDGKQTLIKVKAPQTIIELGAEKMRLKKRRAIDYTWTVFKRDLRTIYADYDAKAKGRVNFSDSERQVIVFYLITSEYGAGLNGTR